MNNEMIDTYVALIDKDDQLISVFANTAAWIMEMIPQLNWSGFYLTQEQVCSLGPFQGRPACNRIGYGQGVVGTAWQQGVPIIVDDVHAFVGHIACDVRSQSELVVPVHGLNGKIIALLDLDAPVIKRFNEKTVALVKSLVDVMESHIKSYNLG